MFTFSFISSQAKRYRGATCRVAVGVVLPLGHRERLRQRPKLEDRGFMWPVAGPPVELGQQGVRPRGARLPVGGGVRGPSPPVSLQGSWSSGQRDQTPGASASTMLRASELRPWYNYKFPKLSSPERKDAPAVLWLSASGFSLLGFECGQVCACADPGQVWVCMPVTAPPRLGHHFPDRTMPKPASHPLSSPWGAEAVVPRACQETTNS